MEIYSEDDYESILRKHESKELKLSEVLDKPTRPFNRAYRNKSEELFHLLILEHQAESKNSMHYSKVRDLSRLKPIRLNDMMVNKVHNGSYLLCKSVSEFTLESCCLYGLVVDESGNRVNIVLENYLKDEEDPNDLFEVGTVFMVKEPFLKITEDEKNYCAISVNTPTDVVVVYDRKLYGEFTSEADAALSNGDYEHLQREGNIYFIAKRYHRALDFYLRAMTVRKTKTALLNVSAAYIGLENYWQSYLHAKQSLDVSLDDSDDANKLKLNEEKARFRMANSLYNMRQWKESIENYEKCLAINANNKEATNGLKLAKDRLDESLTGTYDVKDLFRRVFINKEKNVMVSDYVSSDKMEIRDITKRNKGVFAKTDIKAGTLLVVSKAIALFEDPSSSKAKKSLLMSILASRIRSNPYLAKDFYMLYAGDKFNRNEPVPDGVVDVHRAFEIYRYNTFSNTNIFKAYKDKSQLPLGLWIYPARLNHSCLPNVISIYFNDIMFMYASKDIRANEELTDSYVPADLPYPRRKKEIEKCGFTCNCELCLTDKNDLELSMKREELITELIGSLSQKSRNFDKQLEKYKSLYSNRDKYKYDITTLLTILSTYYYNDGNLKKSATLLMDLFKIQMDYYPMNALDTAMEAHMIFRRCKMEDKAKECLQKALEINIFFDRDTFSYIFHRYLI